MTQGLTLQQLQAMGAKPAPQTIGQTLQQLQSQQVQPPQQSLSDKIWGMLAGAEKVANVVSLGAGKQVGQSIGTLAGLGIEKAKGLLGGQDNSATYDTSSPSIKQVLGDVASGAVGVAGLKLPVPASLLGSAAQLGGLSAIQGAGSKLAEGGTIGEATKSGLISGAVGAGTGAVFNLLGKGISKLAEKTTPSTLSFTSGVPKNAIQETMRNPSVSKQGLNMSVGEIRTKALNSLTSLRSDLGNEFSSGLDNIKQTVPDITKSVGTEAPNAIPDMKSKLVNIGKNLARDYRVSFAKGGVDFSKSNIVSGAEQKNVTEAINTLKTWKDFSPQGTQDLAERIAALRKFESGATTKASAIIGQIYNNIAGEKGVISTLYPELKQLRTNFAVNRKVLDEIGNVLSEGKTKPTQIQGAVSRLDNIFTQNKDEYINAIKQLADRSGVDFPALLAGGEFQKVLPDFVRGLGGGGAVGIGASLLNPWLVLLAPLFSPRAVGSVVRNAPSIAKTTSRVLQAGSAKLIPKLQK